MQALACLLLGAVLDGAPEIIASSHTRGQPSLPRRVLLHPSLFTLGSQGLPLRANAEDPGIGSHERRLQIPDPIIVFGTCQQDAIGIGQNGWSAGRRPDDAKKDGARLVDRASIPNRRDYRNVEFRAEAQHFSRTAFVENLAACDYQWGFRGRERASYALNIRCGRGIV